MEIKFTDEEKVSILLSALDERYESIRAIRGRIQSVSIWSLGLMMAAGGWLIQSEIVLSPFQKFIFVTGALIAVSALRFSFFSDLQKGFKTQQQTAARLETALGMFTPKLFDNENSSIYPESWQRAGADDGEGKFFSSTYLLLYIGTAFLILAIMMPEECGYFIQSTYFHIEL